MAFGFPPKHTQEYQLDGIGEEHFLVLAMEAARNLGWNLGSVNQTAFVAYTKFSWSSWSEEINVQVQNGLVTLRSECTGNQIADWGKNKENIKALLLKIEELKSVLTQEEIELKLSELRLNSSVDNTASDGLSTTRKGQITGVLSIFKPVEGYFVTPVLISINVLVFIMMLVSGVHFLLPESQDLLNWGANFRPFTSGGQWWRLLTACFVHIGVLHLLLNMYALLYVGLLLEPYLGKARFLAAYLITGVIASMASLWWHELTVSAGASGAIFGMYGVFIALLTTNLLEESAKKALLTSIAVFVGYNILNGFRPDSGVDNAAHIGGLISGLLIGYAFVPSLKQFENNKLKFSTIGVMVALLLVSIVTVSNTLSYDIDEYDTKMEEFASMEAMALEVFDRPEGTSKEDILTEIKNRGIYYWNENLMLIDGFEKLNLPEVIREQNSKLKEYCELRIKSYELIYKAVDEDTDKYQSEINEYTKRIEVIIAEIAGEVE